MIQLDGIHHTYRGGNGPVHALRGVDLRVQRGEVFGVIGRSGAGKSSLVRTINLLNRPDQGRVWVDGQDLTALNAAGLRRARHGIGMVFQHFNLVHRSSVLTNVLAGRLGYVNPAWALINRFPREDVDKGLRQLDRVGLADKAHNRADALSGGQQQRVGIARAVVGKPAILIADEPTGNLDPALAADVMRLFEQFNQVGTTVLVASHDLALIARLRHRTLYLKQGRLVSDGLENNA